MKLTAINSRISKASFLGLLFFVSLSLLSFAKVQTVQAVTGDYNKAATGTLAATEWNNLINDFVATSGSRLDGYFSINTATSSAYALDVLGTIHATTFTGSYTGTVSAANVSSGAFGSNTSGGNYTFPGNVGIGIGVATPGSLITIANNRWISALNSAGTSYINMFKVNANDELEIGGALNIGQFQFAEDSGYNTFVDMPVSATPVAGTIEGYVMKVDGDNILSVYSESNGTGGVQNRRIGINTSTPAFTLDVNGIVNATGLYLNGSPYVGSQWTTLGANIYYNTGNVGLGTTTPVSTLDVNGLIKMRTALITANEDVINKGYLDSALASSTASIITQVATSSFWQGMMNGAVYSVNTGNVGVGTTNPGAKFEVYGSSKFGSSVMAGRESTFGADGKLNIRFDDNAGGHDLLTFQNLNGAVGILHSEAIKWQFGRTGNAVARNAGSLLVGKEQEWTSTATTNDSFFALSTTVDGNNTEKLRVNSAGNVGIGITNPAAKLEVNSTYFTEFNTVSNGSYGLRTNGPAKANGFFLAGTSGGFYTVGGNPMFYATPTNDFGMGTTTPSAKLSVAGGNIFIHDSAITSGTPKAAITKEYLDSSLSTFNTENNLWKLNGSNLYASSTTWNLGIGTTTPTEKLTVQTNATGGEQTALTLRHALTGSGDNVAIRFWPAGGYSGMTLPGKIVATAPGGNNIGFNFITNNSGATNTAVSILPSGNVGVGTSNPTQKLSVEGIIGVNYSNIQIGAFGASSVGNTYFSYNGYTTGLQWNRSDITKYSILNQLQASAGSGEFQIYSAAPGVNPITNWVKQFSVSNNGVGYFSGNVGIGTTTPTTAQLVIATSTTNYTLDAGNYRVGNVATPVQNLDAVNKSYMDSALAAATSSISTLWGGTLGGAIYSLNSGNVGIGTTTPQAKLDIVGSNTGVLRFSNTSSGSANWEFRPYIIGVSNGGFSVRDVTNSSDRIVISDTGNVGIGTSSPNAKLNVVSASPAGTYTGLYASVILDSASTGNYLHLKNSDSGSVSSGIILGSGNKNWYINAKGPTVNNIFTLGYLEETADGYTPGGNSLFNVATSGNIGIGITNPSAKLYIVKDGVYNSEGTLGFAITTDNTGTYNTKLGMGVSSGGYGFIQTQTYNGWATKPLLLQAAGGMVGIGTTTPNAALTVNGGNIFINDSAITSGTPKAAITKEYLDSSLTAFNTESNLWKLSGNNVYASSTDWNIGVGTTNPGSRFEVAAGLNNVVAAKITGGYSGAAVLELAPANGLASPSIYLSGGSATYPNKIRAASDFVVETNGASEKLRITTAGNVGIGTTTPGAKLQVNGDLKIEGSGSLKLSGNISQDISLRTGWNGTADTLFFDYSAGSTVMALQGTGNVGIGTNNPTQKLHVSTGNIALTNANSVSTSQGLIKFSAPAYPNAFAGIEGKTNAGGSDQMDLIFYTGYGASSPEKMRILAQSGNVGIGTTTPTTAQLVVSTSTTNYSIDAGNYRVGNVSAPVQPLDAVNKSYLDSAILAATSSITLWGGNVGGNIWSLATGNVGVGTTSPAQKLDVVGNVKARSYYSYDGNGYGGASFYSSYNYLNGEGMIKAAGATYPTVFSPNSGVIIGPQAGNPPASGLLVGGNVGIGGITSPNSRLHVYATSTNSEIDIQSLVGAGNHWGMYSNLSDNSFRVWGGGDYLTILRDGNVGIGTAAPDVKLDVAGALSVGLTESNVIGLSTWAGVNANYGIVGPNGFWGIRSGTAHDFNIDVNNGGSAQSALTILQNGNIGINTSNPGAYRLNVNGNTNITGSLNVTGTTTATAFIGPLTGTLNAANVSSGIFGANTGNGNYGFMGAVAIGTSSPGTYKLNVFGNVFTSGDYAIRDTGYLYVPGAGTLNLGDSGDAINFSFNRMYINSAGNIGIGTTDPGIYRLKVSGDVAITGTLQTQTGSDFAEEFSVSEDIPAGMVVVMADDGHKSVKAADKKYDRTVVGIVSDNPSIIAGKVDSKKKVVVAMMGVVSVNVSNRNGDISKGDLLTSSDISGYAMKASDFRPGTVIGKALEDLSGKSGKIKVLVNLQ